MTAPEDELLVTEILRSWAEHEHPGDEDLSESAVLAALTALAGGASLPEALQVGRSCFLPHRGPVGR
jgi:hypothetical protein